MPVWPNSMDRMFILYLAVHFHRLLFSCSTQHSLNHSHSIAHTFFKRCYFFSHRKFLCMASKVLRISQREIGTKEFQCSRYVFHRHFILWFLLNDRIVCIFFLFALANIYCHLAGMCSLLRYTTRNHFIKCLSYSCCCRCQSFVYNMYGKQRMKKIRSCKPNIPSDAYWNGCLYLGITLFRIEFQLFLFFLSLFLRV